MNELNYTLEEAITLGNNLQDIVTERSPLYVKACVLLARQNATLVEQLNTIIDSQVENERLAAHNGLLVAQLKEMNAILSGCGFSIETDERGRRYIKTIGVDYYPLPAITKEG